jgi:hypothetical protein
VSKENAPQEIQGQEVPQRQLAGVPFGLLCRAIDVQQFLGVGPETWKLWTDAGLKTYRPGTKAEFAITDRLFEFFEAEAALGERPSAVRKRRQAERRKKK